MKLTAKITSIIALLLTLTMVLTGCSALEDILNKILGVETPPEDPPVEETVSGYTISAENQDGLLYFSGSVTDGRFDGVYRDTFATLVNLTEVNGGYIIHFVDSDKVTQYIVINDMAAGAALTTDKFEATIFEWNAELETYVVADDSNNRAFGVGKTSTYTTFSCYDVSNKDYNYGKFTPVNNPTIEKGEGGKPTSGNGGSTGGNTDNFGVIDTPVAGTAYKFGMVQTAAGGTYYLAGGMNGFYMITTTNADEAIDVYLEEVSGGYHLYCTIGGTKTYINATRVTGTDGKEHVNGTYDAAASTVYTYDSTLKTLVVTLGDATYAFGTRSDKTYTTVGPCDISKDNFICQFYGVGGSTGGNGGSTGGNGGNGGNQGTVTPVAGDKYIISANNANGTLYFKGTVTSGRFDCSTNKADAVEVTVSQVDGGFVLSFQMGGATQYIVMADSSTGGSFTTNASEATVFEWNAELNTYMVSEDSNSRAFGAGVDSTYSNFSAYDASSETNAGKYNWGVFTKVGTSEGGNGGSTGGNQGGNAENPFEGGFELGLVPAYDSSYGGYYVINNNTPYFTADEIATAKAGCFEYYAARDNLGRAVMAYACVCNNTRPNDSRGDISSVKPTGWVQKTYDIVPGGSLYNRSHLIAWSLTDEDANWENLVTGTEHMNQKVMTQFENQILSYIKASNSNKVLYRATPIYNGNNLVCTGILLEAYSLDDNGDDISFCVFLYNVQPGISINYANGQSQKGDEAGQNSGLGGTSSGNTGNEGGNQGGTTVTPVAGGSYYVHVTNGNGTLYLNGSITSGRFDGTYEKSQAAKVTVSTVEGGYLLSFGSEYIVISDTSSGASLTNDPSLATVFEWNTSLNTYVVAEDSNNRGFGADATVTKYNNISTYDVSNTQYNWGVFTSVDGSSTPNSGNQGGNTTVPDDNTGNGNTGSDNEDTYTFVLNTSSKKIHDPGCGSVSTMSEKNKKEWTGTYAELQELLSGGYTTCGTCKPAVE